MEQNHNKKPLPPKPNNNLYGQYYRRPAPKGRSYSQVQTKKVPGKSPLPDDAQTQVFTKVGQNQGTPHDPNQYYRRPPIQIPPPDNSATQQIPVVRQTRNPPIDNAATRQIPVVRQGQGGQRPPLQRKSTKVTNQQQNRRRPPNNRPPVRNQPHPISKNESAPATISNVMKAIIYVVAIVVISLFLSIYLIAVGNDVFALVKSNAQLEVTIPDYYTTADIAKILKDKGVINYPGIFQFYASLRKYKDEYVGGTYTISPSMSYDQLVFAFKIKSNAKREEVSVVIREGWTVDRIIDHFVSREMGTRDKFVDVIQNYPFDFWFVQDLTNLSPDRTYRLEGYLFPDTYFFYTDSTEETIIYRMLDNFNTKFSSIYREAAKATGYNVDDIIILASIIQAEGKFAADYGRISSVFWNRMRYPGRQDIWGVLGSDATTVYFVNERDRDIIREYNDRPHPYNTYKNPGLPPGPIGNPSLNAISFALEPDDTNYYFFVSGSDGRTYFAETYDEHNENIRNFRGY